MSANSLFGYSSWLTPLVLQSLKLYQISFGLLPAYSFQIVLNSRGTPQLISAQANKSTRGGLLFFIVYFILMVLSLVKNFFVPNLDNLRSDPLEILRIAIVILCACWVTFSTITPRIILLKEGSMYAAAFQHLFSLNPSPLREPNSYLIPGLLLIYFIIGNVLFGISMGTVLWYIELDPWTFLLNKLLGDIVPLSNPLTLTAKFFLCQFVYFMITRDACVGAILLMFFMIRVDKYLHDLRHVHHWTPQFSLVISSEYVKLWLCVNHVEKYFSSMMLNVTVTCQIILSLSAWVVVKAHELAPTYIVFMFLLIFLGGIALIDFIMKFFASLRQHSFDLKRHQKLQISLNGSSVLKKSALRVWSSNQPIPLKCGDQFYFSKDAAAIYMEVLFTNITNAILLSMFKSIYVSNK